MRAVAVPGRGSGNLDKTTSPTGEVPPRTHGPLAGLVSEDHVILAHPDVASFSSVSATVKYQVRQARGEQELDAALRLRHDVFCVEQGVPEHEELDGRDRDGLHLIAVEDNELLGTCRLLMVGATAQLSRLAVRASARRRGIATALLAASDAQTRAA